MPYISRAEWERAEYITLSEAVAHISECGGCDASSAQRQLHSALKERSLRGLRWQDRQLLTRFSTDDPPMTGPDWAEAEIDWAAGTVRDHWNDTGSCHRVLLIPRHWLLQHWPPAGYRPAWFSFVAAREHVERVAHCSSHHAVEALRAALYDGAARSRFADSGETIDPARWMSPLMLLDGEPIVGEAGRSIKLCRPDIERLWRPAASHASGGGPLVALNAAIERYPENREVVMRRMEAAWQA